MLQGEHSAILLTFIKLPFVNKIVVLSIFEWPLKTGFTVLEISQENICLRKRSVAGVCDASFQMRKQEDCQY